MNFCAGFGLLKGEEFTGYAVRAGYTRDGAAPLLSPFHYHKLDEILRSQVSQALRQTSSEEQQEEWAYSGLRGPEFWGRIFRVS